VLEKFTQDHTELTDALRIRDTGAAESIMNQHIDRGEREILKALKQSGVP
jgi:DNA-binding GntR family transcriptional regulator